MNVQFTNTTNSKLNSLAVSNGQLIALSDRAGLYYDLNNTRMNVTPITLSDLWKTSAGTAASRVGASSWALNQAFAEAQSYSIKYVYTIYYSTTAAGGLGRPVSRAVNYDSSLNLSDRAFVVISHGFNRDWVIVNFACLDRPNKLIWFSVMNYYNADLEGSMEFRIYDIAAT